MFAGQRRRGRHVKVLGAVAVLTSSSAGDLIERPNKKEYTCPTSVCNDPQQGEGFCYEPVCPPGYYRCCATCQEAQCYGSMEMDISWRGIRECIRCPAGHYCDGCDTLTECPLSNRPGREGLIQIAPPGSDRVSACELCGQGYEAGLDPEYCMPAYGMIDGVEVCNKYFLQRCIRSCEPPDPLRREMTACEKMKCTMFCAKEWSEECAKRVEHFCISSTVESDDTGGLAISDDIVFFIENCDVDCSGAIRLSSRDSRLLGVLAILVAFSLAQAPGTA
eukprot:TRINITY_DN30698_c0_g1_i1.p1 TRINITY_DN30698_c0_g1~~TRINITY_DN30698_c0_g1_i1.p1  ORF type:complete len:277 (-),score=52.30 TRINITY_DN30698_c0_g1_i1:110-940(-)